MSDSKEERCGIRGALGREGGWGGGGGGWERVWKGKDMSTHIRERWGVKMMVAY